MACKMVALFVCLLLFREAAQAQRPQGGLDARNAVPDVVEGIAGLMQRFEELQPRLASLPGEQLQTLGTEGQKLHERFIELQQMIRQGGSNGLLPAPMEERLVGFHKDLALFVKRVEGQLGPVAHGKLPAAGLSSIPTLGQRSGVSAFGDTAGAGRASPSFGQGATSSLAPPLGAGRIGAGASRGAATSSATQPGIVQQRLQDAINTIVNGMQRFEALHSQLRALPPPMFQQIATRAEQLHQRFIILQQRGVTLVGDGSKNVIEAEMVPYIQELEAFASEQQAFLAETEQRVASSSATKNGPGLGATAFGGGLGSLGSNPGATLRASTVGGGAPVLSSTIPSATRPDVFGGTPSNGAQISPLTDQKLSAVIKKVVDLMQQFEGMRPQISRLPPQALQPIMQQGQILDARFRALQQHGARIAGDGSKPMSESDASSYVLEMEAFHVEQVQYVEQAQKIIERGGSSSPFSGFTGIESGVGAAPGLPHAKKWSGETMRNTLPSNSGSGSMFGSGGLSSSSVFGSGTASGVSTTFGTAGVGRFGSAGAFGAQPPSNMFSAPPDSGVGQAAGNLFSSPQYRAKQVSSGFSAVGNVCGTYPGAFGGKLDGRLTSSTVPLAEPRPLDRSGFGPLKHFSDVSLNTAVASEL